MRRSSKSTQSAHHHCNRSAVLRPYARDIATRQRFEQKTPTGTWWALADGPFDWGPPPATYTNSSPSTGRAACHWAAQLLTRPHRGAVGLLSSPAPWQDLPPMQVTCKTPGHRNPSHTLKHSAPSCSPASQALSGPPQPWHPLLLSPLQSQH